MAAAPTRTCTGCRKRRPKHELLRFVASGESAEPDPLQRRGGRGVYLCPSAACLDRAARKGGLARGLRRRVALATPGALAAAALQALEEAAAGISSRALADGRARRDADGGLVAAPRVAAWLAALGAQIEELKRCGEARGADGRSLDVQ